MYQEPSATENTKRALYGCLDRIRRAGKHRKLTAEFEERLEEHLEELRQEAAREYQLRRSAMQRIEEHVEKFSKLLEERDQIQQRLHAIDHAYLGSQTALGVAGDCIRDTQAVNREYQGLIKERDDQIVALKQSLENNRGRVADLLSQNKLAGEELIRVQGIARQHLDDCRSAEKMTDDLHEKLSHATTVIGQQEQLIAGQRSAIAGMHAELTHSRVIRKSFIRAQEAFTAVDAALHESAPYNTQKELGDDLVDAELLP